MTLYDDKERFIKSYIDNAVNEAKIDGSLGAKVRDWEGWTARLEREAEQAFLDSKHEEKLSQTTSPHIPEGIDAVNWNAHRELFGQIDDIDAKNQEDENADRKVLLLRMAYLANRIIGRNNEESSHVVSDGIQSPYIQAVDRDYMSDSDTSKIFKLSDSIRSSELSILRRAASPMKTAKDRARFETFLTKLDKSRYAELEKTITPMFSDWRREERLANFGLPVAPNDISQSDWDSSRIFSSIAQEREGDSPDAKVARQRASFLSHTLRGTPDVSTSPLLQLMGHGTISQEQKSYLAKIAETIAKYGDRIAVLMEQREKEPLEKQDKFTRSIEQLQKKQTGILTQATSGIFTDWMRETFYSTYKKGTDFTPFANPFFKYDNLSKQKAGLESFYYERKREDASIGTDRLEYIRKLVKGTVDGTEEHLNPHLRGARRRFNLSPIDKKRSEDAVEMVDKYENLIRNLEFHKSQSTSDKKTKRIDERIEEFRSRQRAKIKHLSDMFEGNWRDQEFEERAAELGLTPPAPHHVSGDPNSLWGKAQTKFYEYKEKLFPNEYQTAKERYRYEQDAVREFGEARTQFKAGNKGAASQMFKSAQQAYSMSQSTGGGFSGIATAARAASAAAGGGMGGAVAGFGAAASAAASAAGPFVMVAAAVLASVSVAYAGTKAMYRFIEGVSKAARELAKYNGTLAISSGLWEAAMIRRNIQYAKETSESGKLAIEGSADMRQSWLVVATELRRMSNVASAIISRVWSIVGKIMTPLFEILGLLTTLVEHTIKFYDRSLGFASNMMDTLPKPIRNLIKHVAPISGLLGAILAALSQKKYDSSDYGPANEIYHQAVFGKWGRNPDMELNERRADFGLHGRRSPVWEGR